MKQVNEEYLKNRTGNSVIDIDISSPMGVEMDEMWSYIVGEK